MSENLTKLTELLNDKPETKEAISEEIQKLGADSVLQAIKNVTGIELTDEDLNAMVPKDQMQELNMEEMEAASGGNVVYKTCDKASHVASSFVSEKVVPSVASAAQEVYNAGRGALAWIKSWFD